MFDQSTSKSCKKICFNQAKHLEVASKFAELKFQASQKLASNEKAAALRSPQLPKAGAKVPAKSAVKAEQLESIIPGFSGTIYVRDQVPGSPYDLHCYQYAETSASDPTAMRPALIAYASSLSDIQAAVVYAYAQRLAVAVRTGGHQYSGFSSTSGQNMILDVSETFTDPTNDFSYNPTTNELRVGVSFSLEELTGALAEMNLFLPHGSCKNVRIGGHVQTGGYGMQQRAFGLFADYVTAIELVVATPWKEEVIDRLVKEAETDSKTAEPRDEKEVIVSSQRITKMGNPDLFAAILGGGVGNYGVLTHITFAPLNAANYPQSTGLSAITLYNPAVLENLLAIGVNLSNDPNYPGDYDLGITIISGQDKSETGSDQTYDDWMRINHPEIYGTDEEPPELLVYPLIQVTMEYAGRTNPSQSYDPTVFNQIRALLPDPSTGLTTYFVSDIDASGNPINTPLSLLSEAWLYLNIREFDMPFIKRTYLYPSSGPNMDAVAVPSYLTQLANTIILNPSTDPTDPYNPNNLKLSMQFFLAGGNNSALATGTGPSANNNTYDWRSKMRSVTIIDDFYRQTPTAAAALQADSDSQLAALGYDNHRMVWCTFLKAHDTYNMKDEKCWSLYYKPSNFNNLKHVKTVTDPAAVFSSNQFAIPRLGSEEFKAAKAKWAASRGKEDRDEAAASATTTAAKNGSWFSIW